MRIARGQYLRDIVSSQSKCTIWQDTESNYNLCNKQFVYSRLQIYTGIITISCEMECRVGACSINEIEKLFGEVKHAEKHDIFMIFQNRWFLRDVIKFKVQVWTSVVVFIS